MKKSLIFALTALLAVSFTFFGCPSNPSNGGGSDSEKENPDTPDTPSVGINEELTFKCVKQSWGASGSLQIDLPEEITVAEGDIVVINGTFEFDTPSTGTIVQLYPQDTVGYKAPDWNWIADFDNGLAGVKKTIENYEWSIAKESAGTWSKIQWVLGWENKDENADATCIVKLTNVTITKK